MKGLYLPISLLLALVLPLMLSAQEHRVNCSGDEYTDENGNVFAADQEYTEGGYGYVGGTQKFYDHEISGTDDDTLYQYLRFHADSFSYIFDGLADDIYEITLHFIEPEMLESGMREFDIFCEDELVLDNFDIFTTVGDTFTAVIQSVVVEVSDGQLNMDFVGVNDKALVCAIEVVPEPLQTSYIDVAETVGLELSHTLDSLLCPPPISTGSAWVDFDSDGDVDFYVTSHGSSNHLYRNDGDLNSDDLPDFTDVAADYAVDSPELNSIGAVFIDYDNDGDQDLYVTNVGGNSLFQNQLTESGSVDFIDATEFAGVADDGRGITSAWADFDQDGYLDFYVTKHAHCMETNWNNVDALFHNNGDGTFTNVSDWLCQDDGDCPHEDGLGFSPGWFDYDDDGDLDLYLVNDILSGIWERNVLWRNDGSDGEGGWIFTDVSEESGTDIGLNGMGLGIGDYDNDGWMDLAFSNGGPNYLLNNNGDGTFDDVSEFAGIERDLTPLGDMSVTWGTTFLDYDNDGWLDLYFVAGNIGAGSPPQPNAFFSNNQDGTFTDNSVQSGMDDPRRGRHAAVVDFDEDGYVDVFVGNYSEAPNLFRNNSEMLGVTNNWLHVTVEGTVSNRDGIGARIYLTTVDGLTQVRDINSGPTHGGGDYRAAYFGLSSSNTGTISVRWPTGEVEAYGTFVANQRLHLVEGSSQAASYVDVTSAVGLDLLHQLDESCPMPPIGSGSAWADYDNDGDVDLFVTNHGGPNKLYRNDGDSDEDGLPSYTDVAANLNIDDADLSSHSCVFIDYDNDGDQDLYVTHYGGNTLYQNVLVETSVAAFVDVTEFAGVADNGRGITSAWADFDQDGDLDFYVAKHFFCMPDDASNHDPLFLNNGDGTFSNVSSWLCQEGGECPHEEGLGFSPGWTDYDNDGDLDLYLANDVLDGWHANTLWRNDGSDGEGGWIFTDVSAETNTDVAVSAMGLGVGDYDNDGWIDLAFSNGGPNYLLRNLGDGTYEDVSEAAGIQRDSLPSGASSVTWGTVFFDYNNDAWLDLYFVAGKISDLPVSQPNALFLNNMDGTFTDVSDGSGLEDEGRGRSGSIADINGDGYVDVMVGNYGQPGHLLLNNGPATGTTNHWLAVTVEGTVSNRDGIGTRLYLSTGDGITQLREINTGPTHGGGDYRAAFFGLGENEAGDLTIHWPTGTVEEIGSVTGDQYLHFVEPDSATSIDEAGDHDLNSFSLAQNYPNPFNPTTTIHYSLKNTIKVSIKIFNVLGQEVATLVDQRQQAGPHGIVWDGRNNDGHRVASGIYIYRMKAGEFVQSHKMLLAK